MVDWALSGPASLQGPEEEARREKLRRMMLAKTVMKEADGHSCFWCCFVGYFICVFFLLLFLLAFWKFQARCLTMLYAIDKYLIYSRSFCVGITKITVLMVKVVLEKRGSNHFHFGSSVVNRLELSGTQG